MLSRAMEAAFKSNARQNRQATGQETLLERFSGLTPVQWVLRNASSIFSLPVIPVSKLFAPLFCILLYLIIRPPFSLLPSPSSIPSTDLPRSSCTASTWHLFPVSVADKSLCAGTYLKGRWKRVWRTQPTKITGDVCSDRPFTGLRP